MVNTVRFCSGSDGEVYNNSYESKIAISNRSQLGNLKKSKNIICCYINMNSVRNQFKHLCGLSTGHEGTTSNAETKLDSSFPISQFLIPGFHKPFKMDIDSRKGILVYIKSSLPSNFLTNFKLPDEAQIIPFEVNLKKER